MGTAPVHLKGRNLALEEELSRRPGASGAPMPGSTGQIGQVGRAKGLDPSGAGQSHDVNVVGALSTATPSVDQLGMGLRLRLNRHQIIKGVELAIIDHRAEAAKKANVSLGK